MAGKKTSSTRKALKEAAPVLGAVGAALTFAGGASAAATGPAIDTQAKDVGPRHQVTITEEEVSDVSLATFYVFDKENTGPRVTGEKVAWWVYRGCRCGWGCRRCRGCGCRC